MTTSTDQTAPSFAYDSIDVGYYDRIYHRNAGVQSAWHHQKFDHVRAMIAPGSRHLDIGCGPGTFIGGLDETIQSIGVDIAQAQIDYAQKQYGSASKSFVKIEPGPIPFVDHSFDVVTSIELMEHLDKDAGLALMKEARRVLKPSGVFMLTTPDYGGGWPALEWIVNRVGELSYEDQHITHFTRASLTDTLAQAGFRHVDVERFQFLSPFAAVLGFGAARRISHLEPRFLTSRLGFLLLGVARADALQA